MRASSQLTIASVAGTFEPNTRRYPNDKSTQLESDCPLSILVSRTRLQVDGHVRFWPVHVVPERCSL